MADIDPGRKEFYLKEYESLKAEIAELVDHSRKVEIYAVGSMAAFYAWFIKEGVAEHALLIPVILAILGAFRSLMTLFRLKEIGTYLRAMESDFKLGGAGPGGWESYLKARQARKGFSIGAAPFVISAAVIWIVLMGLSFCLWLSPVLQKALQANAKSPPCSDCKVFFVKPLACHAHCDGPEGIPPAVR